MFKLKFHTGSLGGNSLEVAMKRVVVGRTKECDVCLNEDGVSRRHCVLEKREDGIYVCD
jgi:pSer/pThr/pTyr-binding forkhead associated (FHA) protein